MSSWKRVGGWSVLSLAALAAVPAVSRAVVIGDWENQPDGWIDWSSSQQPLAEPKFSYSTTVGVTHGSTSLRLNHAGWNQNLSIKLQNTGHREEFFANKKFAIDVTLPATTTSGWSQIFQFVINAQEYGFTSQLPEPIAETVVGWGDGGGPERRYTFTYDYSHLIDGDAGNGEIPPTAGWVEFIFATNNDGVHTEFYFDNARLFGAPVPGDVDGDGDLDRVDLDTLLSKLGTTGGGVAAGDINGDGRTSTDDLALFNLYFSQSQAPAAGQAVPEPSAVALGLIAALGARRARRGA